MFDNPAYHLDQAITLLAVGLVRRKRLLDKHPSRYPYSPILHRGMDLFLGMSLEAGRDDVLSFGDETAFANAFLCRPVETWFDGWDPYVREQLKDEPFYSCGPLVEEPADGSLLLHMDPSQECFEFLELHNLLRDGRCPTWLPGSLMEEIQERAVYERMRSLSQEDYVLARRTIIEHPILSRPEYHRQFHLLGDHREVQDLLKIAWESYDGEGWRCPVCGWTMEKTDNRYHCISRSCVSPAPNPATLVRLAPDEGWRRLKPGVMRFIAAPGRLELEIDSFCREHGLDTELWPEMDTYDVEIRFPDGARWEIDAKCYQNPRFLTKQIRKNPFQQDDFEKGFYVVPDEVVKQQNNYLAVVRKALADEKNIDCVTLSMLKDLVEDRKGGIST